MKRFSWKTLPKPFSVLAPMEDVTDTVFRRIVASCARPDVFFSEFTSTDGMFSPGEMRVVHRLDFTEDERPIIAQIWGNNPEKYLRAAKRLEEMGFDGIDINMGCPVPKIVANGACSALIDNPTLAQELVLAAREGAPSMQLSVKTRLGFKEWKTEEWCSHLLSLKPDALTIHGRLAKDLSKKPAQWDEIARVAPIRDELSPDTVVIGNGDVTSYDQFIEYSERFNVDGVMIGRGVFENLYIFDPTGKRFSDLSRQEKLAHLRRHIELFMSCWSGRKPYRILKKYYKIYCAHFRGAAELRMKLVETETPEEAYQLIDEWTNSEQSSAEKISSDQSLSALSA